MYIYFLIKFNMCTYLISASNFTFMTVSFILLVLVCLGFGNPFLFLSSFFFFSFFVFLLLLFFI